MLDRLLPRQADNTFRGHRFALWLLGALVVMKGGIGVGTMVNGRAAAVEADGIPLDAFTPAGEQAFLALLAAWGLGHLMLNLIALVVLIRYRALVAFMFVVLLVEHLLRVLVFVVLPIPRDETPPGVLANLVFVAAMVAGLALSLWRRSAPAPPPQT